MDYSQLASDPAINQTTQALNQHNINTIVVATGQEALTQIKQLIPSQASVMNGSSYTLEQIGFIDYLQSETHSWNNLHAAIVAEKDPAQQASLRKQALLSDYYLGSVHALTTGGEFIIASNTGSQLPHIVFSSQNVIFVVGAQKIVPTLNDALQRLEQYVFPLEDARLTKLYGRGTAISKIVIFKRENENLGRKVTMILVKEALGF